MRIFGFSGVRAHSGSRGSTYIASDLASGALALRALAHRPNCSESRDRRTFASLDSKTHADILHRRLTWQDLCGSFCGISPVNSEQAKGL